MEYLEHKTIDKSEWERGEWDNEPDKIQWQDESSSYPCLIVRHPSGHLCGYVGVAKGHPAYEVNHDNVPAPIGDDYDDYINVHGGLTFDGKCMKRTDKPQEQQVCHVVEEGEDNDIWWLGFDCAHSGDYSSMSYPEKHREKWPHTEDIYRNIGYVKHQCKLLAGQLKALAGETQ